MPPSPAPNPPLNSPYSPPLPSSFSPPPSPYYREPAPCPAHGIPVHLVEPLARSFNEDHFVADEGNIVFYQKVRVCGGESGVWIGCVGGGREWRV